MGTGPADRGGRGARNRNRIADANDGIGKKAKDNPRKNFQGKF